MTSSTTVAETTKPGKATIGLWAVFITYFLFNFFMQAINIIRGPIAQELNGMEILSWSMSLPALGAAVATLVFGALSDMYGRRPILIVAMSIFTVGVILNALMTTFPLQIVAFIVSFIGYGALAPLCFSVLGDLFEPEARARWSGLMGAPGALAAFLAPTAAGWINDSWGWRAAFWIHVPFILLGIVLIAIGVPGAVATQARKFDYLGTAVMVVAAAMLIVGVSLAGMPGMGWTSPVVLALIVGSIIAWVLFYMVERKAAQPLLEPQLLTNRVFMTAALTGFVSFISLLGILAYFPIFLQQVQGVSATQSGATMTPFTVLMTVMGIPGGFALAQTKKYKWIYLVGYTLWTIAAIILVTFTRTTRLWLAALVTGMAGFGLGSIPTVNTLVAQFSVPKRMLGVAVGAIYFFVNMGQAIAPAILGTAMNVRMASGGSLEEGLRMVFIIGAVAMVICVLMIATIPQISITEEAEDKRAVVE